jgi:hypothetical protein
MAISICPSCRSSFFETKEVEPRNAGAKLTFIQCASCGTVVGVSEFFSTANLLRKHEAALKAVAAGISELRDLLSQLPQASGNAARRERRRSPRVKVALPFEYRVVDGQTTQAEPRRGVIRDLGYHGLLGELPTALSLHSEIKLEFDLPPLACRARDIHARIVSLRREEGRNLAGLAFTSLAPETQSNIQRLVVMNVPRPGSTSQPE